LAAAWWPFSASPHGTCGRAPAARIASAAAAPPPPAAAEWPEGWVEPDSSEEESGGADSLK